MSDTSRMDECIVVYPKENAHDMYVWAESARKLERENAALREDKERLIIILQHLVNTAKRAMKEAGRDGAEWDIKDELSEAYAAIDAARKAQP